MSRVMRTSRTFRPQRRRRPVAATGRDRATKADGEALDGRLVPRLSGGRGTTFPLQLRATLRYREFDLQTAAGVGYADTIFRGNSIYDPAYAAGGESPAEYDKFATLYQIYKVVGSRIKVTCDNGQSTFPVLLTVYANLDPGSASVTTVDGQAGAQNVVIPPIHNGAKTVSLYRRTQDMVQGHNGEDTLAAFGSNPALPWYWHVCTQLIPNSANALVSYLHVEIEYDVIFSKPIAEAS